MSSSSLPNAAPDRTAETEAFWEATTRDQLLLPHCDGCSAVIWYPRTMCPMCGSVSVSWIEASGRGTIYSFTVVHKSLGTYEDSVPYVIAYVELAEGPRVLTNIVGCDSSEVHIGQRVSAVFFDTGEGSALYRFEPTQLP